MAFFFSLPTGDSSCPLAQPKGSYLRAAGQGARMCPYLGQAGPGRGRSEPELIFSQRGELPSQGGHSFPLPQAGSRQSHAALSEEDSSHHPAARKDAQLPEKAVSAAPPRPLQRSAPDTRLPPTPPQPAPRAPRCPRESLTQLPAVLNAGQGTAGRLPGPDGEVPVQRRTVGVRTRRGAAVRALPLAVRDSTRSVCAPCAPKG